MKKNLIAPAFGTAEFGMMGMLSDSARSPGVSIPETGHPISAYAPGVCFGAPPPSRCWDCLRSSFTFGIPAA